MKFYLRAIEPQLVDAWKLYFKNEPDVEVSEGDIFGIKSDAIVSPANSYGFMDGGIDMAYSLKFGWDLQDDLQTIIREEYYGELLIGQAAIVPMKNQDYKYLISAPTMRIPMNVSGTVNAYLAFRATCLAALDHNRKTEEVSKKIDSVLCPGLGTGIGKMPSLICAQQMYLAYRLIMQGDTLEFLELGHAYVADRKLRGISF